MGAEADGAREYLCALTEQRSDDTELVRGPCRRCVRNEGVDRCSLCGCILCYDCARISYEAGGIVCLQPCTFRDMPPMSGSSSFEPGTAARANSGRTIGPSFCCSNFGGLQARRRGSERVRRNITVIQEGVPDMDTMPDHELDPRAYAPDTIPYSGSYNISQGEREPACADHSVANGSDFQRIVDAPEGVLPSDLVPSMTMQGRDGSNYAIMGVMMLALFIADVIASARVFVSVVCTICGRGPQGCRKACRLIVDHRTRTTCGRACCLPEDHGAVWNHTCTEHVQLG